MIGSRTTLSPESVLAATIALEISHFIQYRYWPDTRWLQKRYRKPHGEGFQDIYRILGGRVINPHFNLTQRFFIDAGYEAAETFQKAFALLAEQHARAQDSHLHKPTA